jgi:OmpA-OmpF porin, OOP family
MRMQQCVLGLVLAMAASAAVPDSGGMLRWRSGVAPLGLQAAAADARLPCTSYTLACSDASSVSLYSSETAPRTLSMQISEADRLAAMRIGRAPGLNLSLVGKAGIAQDLGVYGRVGTTVNRPGSAVQFMGAADGGLTYGVGLSWDFSRRAAAAVGLDAYDVRGLGEVRDWRTSLGLQWRY